MEINAVIFDIGNVLVDWNPDHLLLKLLPDAAAVARFRREAVTPRRILNMDLGQSWEEQLAEIEAEMPQHLETARSYAERWIETIAGPVPGSVELLHKVQERGVPAYALSNFGRENFDRFADAYSFAQTFDDRIISAHVGMIKPDPQIFRLAIDKFCVDPATTLFIDDRPENIATAVECGLHGHLFREAKILRAEMTLKGVGR